MQQALLTWGNSREGEQTPQWAFQDRYALLGHRVALRSTSPRFARDARRWLRSFSPVSPAEGLPDTTLSVVATTPPDAPGSRPWYTLHREDWLVGRTASYWQLLRYLEIGLDSFLAAETRDHYLIHAGAVVRKGAGIILPGPSGRGKTSLTLALLEQGYDYLCDEFAVIDPASGRVTPFPKPLSIKTPKVFPELARRPALWQGPRQDGETYPGAVHYLHPLDLRPDWAGSSAPVRYIIFPTYTPGRPPELDPLAPEVAMRRLIDQSVNLNRFGSAGLELLAELVQNARCYSLTTGDLSETTRLIDQLTGSD